MKNFILKLTKISNFWVWGIILIFSLLLAEYYYLLTAKTSVNIGSSAIEKYIMYGSFGITIITSVVVWLISTLLFHLCATLLGGKAQYNSLRKISAITYGLPSICVVIAIFIFDRMTLPAENIPEFLKTNSTFIFINHLINYSFITYYILLLLIIKYVYDLNWYKAFACIAIPVASIGLLGYVFSKFIL